MSYGWPVKPFNRQHPVRGSFGDPRSVFRGTPTLRVDRALPPPRLSLPAVLVLA